MAAIWAMAMKDLKLLMRDRIAAFFTFVFPLLIALLFGFIFAPAEKGDAPNKMKVLLLNEDGGPASIAFVSDLKASESLAISDVASRDEALTVVRKGKDDVVAAVIIPKGFQESAENMFSGKAMQITGIVNPSRTAEAGLLEGKLNEIGFRQMSRTFNDPSKLTGTLDSARKSVSESTEIDPLTKGLFTTMFSAMDGLAKKEWGRKDAAEPGKKQEGFNWQPVKVTMEQVKPEGSDEKFNSFEISFPQGIVWGLMGCVISFGTGIASERTAGTLMRLTTSPLSRSDILLGKALACFIACILVQLFVIGFGLAIGKLTLRDPTMLLLAMFLCSFGFVGVMMLLAGVCRTEAAAGGFGRAILLMLALIGGGSIPIMFMRGIMKPLSNLSPFKWANQVVSGALWQGFQIQDMLLPGGVLIAMGLAGYAIGASAFRWGDGK
ncbi:MAG: ABC transporter permease [Phycisphaerales bacterium]